MRYLLPFTLLWFVMLYLVGCGSGGESVKTVQNKDTLKTFQRERINPPEPIYDIIDRYIVSNSNISFDKSDSTNVEDAVTGEFVKLKSGNKYSVVIHQFETDSTRNEKLKEIVLAFELSGLEKGIRFYPERFTYYLMSYTGDKSRIDGKMIHGYIMFDKITDSHVYGSFDFTIEGLKKSFDQNDLQVEVVFRSNFKLPIIDIANIRK